MNSREMCTSYLLPRLLVGAREEMLPRQALTQQRMSADLRHPQL